MLSLTVENKTMTETNSTFTSPVFYFKIVMRYHPSVIKHSQVHFSHLHAYSPLLPLTGSLEWFACLNLQIQINFMVQIKPRSRVCL